MENEYAKNYRDLYRNHWWWQAREQAILREIEMLGFERDGSRQVLDVGCGDGLLFDALQPFGAVQGVEADPATLDPQGRWRSRIHNQPFDDRFQPGQQFDLILMLDLLEHLGEPAAALAHARSLLRPGGRMILTVPAFKTLWTSHDDLNHHVTRYTRATFARLAKSAGVALEKMHYLFHWTCPVKLAIRCKESVLPFQARLPEVPARWLNKACYALTRAEQLTISRMNMPFGSSLLAVAVPTASTGLDFESRCSDAVLAFLPRRIS